MKEKILKYLSVNILLPITIIIWGAIGLHLYKYYNNDIPEITNASLDVSFNPKRTIEIDTFSFQTTDRDPFLGTLTKKQTNKPSKAKTVSKTKKSVCPLISYHGLIKKQNSSQKIFVININNTQHLLKQGQKTQDITFLKGNAKEIVVRCNKELKTIPIQ